MKTPTGTSYASDHRFGGRARMASAAERDDCALRESSRMSPWEVVGFAKR
jgi:hypothetical protein